METPVIENTVQEAHDSIVNAVRGQRLRRRLVFWAGFFTILIVGSLWAGLTKDPLGNRFFDDGVIFDEPAFDDAVFEEPAIPVPLEEFEFVPTTVGPETEFGP